MENDVRVYLGKLMEQAGKVVLSNNEDGWSVSLDDEQVSRLKAVPEEPKQVLRNADFFIQMSMGSIDNNPGEGYIDTGIDWK